MVGLNRCGQSLTHAISGQSTSTADVSGLPALKSGALAAGRFSVNTSFISETGIRGQALVRF